MGFLLWVMLRKKNKTHYMAFQPDCTSQPFIEILEGHVFWPLGSGNHGQNPERFSTHIEARWFPLAWVESLPVFWLFVFLSIQRQQQKS